MTAHAREGLFLRSISKVITVLVPSLLSNPSVVVSMSSFYGLIAFHEHIRCHSGRERGTTQGSLRPMVFSKYTGHCVISTREYWNKQANISGRSQSLWNALLRSDYLHEGNGIARLARVATNAFRSIEIRQSAVEKMAARRKEVHHVAKRMRSWVFEETGIMVPCKIYVASVMGFCSLLVVGGLSIGLSLGPRIKGVDPFNITTYSWALAAFIILMAKNVRVRDWPWHDFLHLRLFCKTVSEVSSITGIDDQLILAKLVQCDQNSILRTSGPFNQVFDVSRSGDGFSIDRPMSMWAMLISGFIMIEVENLDGRSLVCLDLRKGTKLCSVTTRVENQVKYFEGLYSKKGGIPNRREREGPDEEVHGTPNRVQLKRGTIGWTRALGLYSNKDAFFV